MELTGKVGVELLRCITGHLNTDLDSFSSMVAAQKLFPDAVLIRLGQVQDKVREIISLHKDLLNLVNVNKLSPDQISEIIIVDTNSLERIGKLGTYIKDKQIKIKIFDHHPLEDNLIKSQDIIVEQVGATATILVEQIREREIKLSPLEASLIALGIYDDTACFTSSSTTYRDAQALSFLLFQGANLNFISQFIGNNLSEEQWDLMNLLLDSLKHYKIKGRKIYFCKEEVDKYLGGLALITQTIVELKDLPILFSIVKMKDRTFVVGRSNVNDLSVLTPIKFLGGGGHNKAASAIVRNEPLDLIEQRIVSVLKNEIKPELTAKDIMSSPVKTVKPNLKLADAYKILLRYGHTGLPVLEEQQLVGVISRRDMEKALQHRLGHAPIKAYMNRNIKYVRPDFSLDEIRKLMIENDIGRLPVLDQRDNLIGIVTRTDLLKYIHGKELSNNFNVYKLQPKIKEELTEAMEKIFPEEIFRFFCLAGELAEQVGVQVFMVGGIVRDLLLGKNNYDLDLVVEGDGIQFAKKLADKLDGKLKVVHKRFGTAVLNLDCGKKIDISTARTEFYESPAALPIVEHSSLKQDLYRRDFTINTLAIKLNKNSFGTLLDFFDGTKDLKNGKIRVLHNFSFVDDPTRIFRAVRFEQRYNFTIEYQTEHLIKLAIEDRLLDRLTNQRIAAEILHILAERQPENSLQRLSQLGVLNQISPSLIWNNELAIFFVKVCRIYKCLKPKIKEKISLTKLYLKAWLFKLKLSENDGIWEMFDFSAEKIIMISSLDEDLIQLENRITNSQLSNSELVAVIEQFGLIEHIFLLANTDKKEVFSAFDLYYNRLAEINPYLKGKDLLELGFKQGRLLGKCLQELKKNKLDGNLTSREEEIIFAQKFLIENQGGA